MKRLIKLLKKTLSKEELLLFYKELEKECGQALVKVISARELSGASREVLVDRFPSSRISFVIDKSLIGGVKIRYNGQEVDSSIKRKLAHGKNS